MLNRTGLFVLAFVVICARFVYAATDIEIVSPRGGETYLAGQTQYIRLAATTKFKVIQIDLSRDGGATFTPLGSINNTGAKNMRDLLAFSVQGSASINCQIRATATQGKTTGSGLSGDFTINVTGAGALPPLGLAGGDLTGSYPSPQIATNAVTTPKLADGAVTNAKINSGAASSDFVLAADGNGGANWTSPLNILPLVGAPYVLKTGDTMTGLLTLSGNPTINLHAASKQYVDAETTRGQTAETALTTNLNNEVTRATTAESTLTTNLNSEVTRATAAEGAKVAKAGDTMMGLLTLSGNPTAIFHAATKQYVDAETTRAQGVEATLTTNFNGEITRAILAEGTLTTNLTNEVSRATTAESTLTTNKVSKAGDTMTGLLTLSGDPTVNLHAATKQYVDAEKTRAQAAESTLTTNLNAEVTARTTANTTLQTNIDAKVAKAGDTMTGALTLNADPTNALHAATKQYVDAGNSALNATISALPTTPIYGDGSDGNVVITVDTNLQTDMFYNNLTVNSGINLNARGRRIFVRNVCIINGTISNNANADGTGASTFSIGGGGSPGNTVVNGFGGAGGTGAGGSPSIVITPLADTSGGMTVLRALPNALACRGLNGDVLYGGSAGGSGAGSNNFGGGAGGFVMIAARVFSGSGIIQAKGGSGVSGYGGGGGGGGGVIVTVSTNSPSAVGIALDVSGGIGGASSVVGFPGTNGSVGRIYTLY